MAAGMALPVTRGAVSISQPKPICSGPEWRVSGGVVGDHEGPVVQTKVRHVWKVTGEDKGAAINTPWSKFSYIFVGHPLANGKVWNFTSRVSHVGLKCFQKGVSDKSFL